MLAHAANGAAEKERFKRAWDSAKAGDLDEIDADIRLRFYGTIKRIKQDYQVVPASLPTLDFHWFTGPAARGRARAHGNSTRTLTSKTLTSGGMATTITPQSSSKNGIPL